MRKWNMSLAQARELQSTGMTMVAGPAPTALSCLDCSHGLKTSVLQLIREKSFE